MSFFRLRNLISSHSETARKFRRLLPWDKGAVRMYRPLGYGNEIRNLISSHSETARKFRRFLPWDKGAVRMYRPLGYGSKIRNLIAVSALNKAYFFVYLIHGSS